jgi:hypothetical protein
MDKQNLGGERGIRTPDGLAPITVFKTAAFNHSAISPSLNFRLKILSSIEQLLN